MMGTKERNFQPLPDGISLEGLVPKDNLYRRLEATLDLSFVRELVRDRYATRGRPSVDPAVFFRLQLVMFFEGIRSECQLMRVVADRISLRWFVGYDLHEPLPDHSSLTRIRERYGIEVFRLFFERIVEECFVAGLVWGKELFFDSTAVEANAANGSIVPRLSPVEDVEDHLGELFEGAPAGIGPGPEEEHEETPKPPTAALPTSGDETLGSANRGWRDWISENGRPDRTVKRGGYSLEEHYRGRPMGWASLLAHYRGNVTHHGYLDILEAGHDTEELIDIVFHLHDALARILLKICGFDGGYKPGTIVHDVIPVPVAWVKPHFSARALGYKK